MENPKQVMVINEDENRNVHPMEEIPLRPQTFEGAAIDGVAADAQKIQAADEENPAMKGSGSEVSPSKSISYHGSIVKNPEFRAKLEQIRMKSGDRDEFADKMDIRLARLRRESESSDEFADEMEARLARLRLNIVDCNEFADEMKVRLKGNRIDAVAGDEFTNEMGVHLGGLHLKSGDDDANTDEMEVRVSEHSDSSASTTDSNDNRHDCLTTSMYCCLNTFDCIIM